MGGGINNLVLVDFDNAEVQEKALPLLPETFTVKTGSGMLHLYYFTNNTGSFKGFNEDLDTLFDCQSEGKQVIGPGSIHPNGNYYQVVKDMPIANIDYAELKAKLMQFDRRPKKELVEVKKDRKEYAQIAGDDFVDEIKSRISMSEILSYCGVNTSMNPTGCPFHSSKGGKCLGFNDKTAHCFHCEGSWNIFSLIKEYKKCDFKGALDILAKMAGLEDKYIDSKEKYKDKKKKEGMAMVDKKRAEELDKIKQKNVIKVPGDNRTMRTIDGEVQDPIKDKIIRAEIRMRTTRGTTLAPDPQKDIIKIKVEEAKKDGNTN
jgi:hypothetical protein